MSQEQDHGLGRIGNEFQFQFGLDGDVFRAATRQGPVAAQDEMPPGSAEKFDSFHAFSQAPIVDLLEQESRPTFVIDLSAATISNSNAPLEPIYCNPSLKSEGAVLGIVLGLPDTESSRQENKSANSYADFQRWVFSTEPRSAHFPHQPTIVYRELVWRSSTLQNRWRVVNGYQSQSQHRLARLRPSPGLELGPIDEMAHLQSPKRKRNENGPLKEFLPPARPSLFVSYKEDEEPDQIRRFDWTSKIAPPQISSHIQLVRSVDWASTALGPMKEWSSLLRIMCNHLMACPNPAVLFWGEELSIIYNATYPQLVGEKHPKLIGQPARVGFAEAWDNFEPFFNTCRDTGHGAAVEHMQVFLNRGLCPNEETYWSFSFIPVIGPDDNIKGWYENVIETTSGKTTERRMRALLDIGESTAAAENVEAFWMQLSKGIEAHPCDISFTLVYSVISLGEMSAESASGVNDHFELQGTVSVPAGHPSAPNLVDETLCSNLGFTEYFQAAASSNEPLHLSIKTETLRPSLIEGIYSSTFNDPCTSVVVCAIRPSTALEGTPIGFMVLGLNPRRPYDTDYQQFIHILLNQVTSSLAAVLLLEEQIRRGRTIQEQAIFDQQRVETQLRLRTKELEDSETRFKKFVDLVPAGLFMLEYSEEYPGGYYRYRNDNYFAITGDSRDVNVPAMESPVWRRMHPDDVAITRENWGKAESSRSSNDRFEFTFRVKAEHEPMDSSRWTHILIYATSAFDDDGSLRSIFASATDITVHKEAEDMHRLRMEDALEAKRQQENFIDVTSHEMRNPLSAIMISADEIISSLRSLNLESCSTQDIQACIDAAEIVMDCAQHQKRIVDDILTISKLDSGLFAFTPLDVQPVGVVKSLLKMFEGEFVAADISTAFEIAPSYLSMAVDWVMLDSSRLLQILINLVSNAVKFTRLEKTRNITIRLNSSIQKPSELAECDIEYPPPRRNLEDLTMKGEWGDGEEIYLQFAVCDTGRGISEEERRLLFNRFTQAPRTHVKYGGSGMGLFISRELAEMQGGQIGVRSESRKGSTFAFYVKTRRSTVKVHSVSRDFTDLALPAMNMRTLGSVNLASPSPTSPQHPTRRKNPLAAIMSTASSASAGNHAAFHALIVEDNVVNQRVLSRQLLKLGYEVSIANHGGEALEFLRTTTFWNDDSAAERPTAPPPAMTPSCVLNLILMDLEMPVIDGLTAIKKIRAMQLEGQIKGHVPVIAITANARVEQVREALDAGMDDVVSKPFRVPHLISRIEMLNERLGGLSS